MMYNIARYDALYGHQSVDKKDSISVESQLDFCKYETHGQSYQPFYLGLRKYDGSIPRI